MCTVRIGGVSISELIPSCATNVSSRRWGPGTKELGVTLSLPSVLGKDGVVEVLERPGATTDQESKEEEALRASAGYLAEAMQRLRDGTGWDQPLSLTWTEWSRQLKRGGER